MNDNSTNELTEAPPPAEDVLSQPHLAIGLFDQSSKDNWATPSDTSKWPDFLNHSVSLLSNGSICINNKVEFPANGDHSNLLFGRWVSSNSETAFFDTTLDNVGVVTVLLDMENKEKECAFQIGSRTHSAIVKRIPNSVMIGVASSIPSVQIRLQEVTNLQHDLRRPTKFILPEPVTRIFEYKK